MTRSVHTTLPILTALVLVGALMTTGCGRPPTAIRDPQGSSGPKGDPWEGVAKRLRKDTDLVACKSALSTLNHELSGGEPVEKPTALSPQAEKELAALVPLHPTDAEEIRPAVYSPHDPVYLAECLYLRDAARSLQLPGLTPEQLADLGFAWVCRQVYLSPWLIDTGDRVLAAALPPSAILRRGSGSALERMYVFLALLQQMGLDACLIGPPQPGEVGGVSALSADRKSAIPGGPARPFWAVGVRIEANKKSDIKLYDPWRGEAFPATLSQLKGNPDSHRAWIENPSNHSGLTLNDLKQATAFLAVPVNSLSPRMALLERKLKDPVDVDLAINPTELRNRFADPKPAFWNPPNDRFAYGRTARAFLPVDQGGADRSERSTGRLYESYLLTQLPGEQEIIPLELRRAELKQNKDVLGDIKDRISIHAKGAYGAVFMDHPTPRERIQRGQFRDAARVLVEAQSEFAKSRDRVRHTPDADTQMRNWVTRAIEIYGSLGSDPNARAALDEHWKSSGAALLLDRAIGEVGQAEAALLLALCRHEEAERAQARLERSGPGEADKLKAPAILAWTTATRAWSSYREQFAASHSSAPGLSEHLTALANRAKKLSQQ